MICKLRAADLDVCQACGHTGLMHPGTHNPALSGCALCYVEALVTERNERADDGR